MPNLSNNYRVYVPVNQKVNQKDLHKDILEIKWELENEVLTLEERVDNKILLKKFEAKIAELMKESGLK